MSLEEDLSGLGIQEPAFLTIGVFDGVHLGHRKLLDVLKRKASSRGCLSGVITFSNHPLSLLGRCAPPQLIDQSTKNDLLKAAGADFVLGLEFSQELAQTSARDFCRLLQTHLNMQGLVLGFDFAMGRNREGSLDTIRELGKELAFEVDVVPPVFIDDCLVSSTNIRQALLSGNVQKACRLLGRYYSLQGTVVKGEGIGEKLGFPTANINIDPCFVVPPDGIYATVCRLDGRILPSATNIGTGPTFGRNTRLIEVHLLDFNGSLYGQQIKLDIIEFIREERFFAKQSELVEQIKKDIAEIRKVLERKGL